MLCQSVPKFAHKIDYHTIPVRYVLRFRFPVLLNSASTV